MGSENEHEESRSNSLNWIEKTTNIRGIPSEIKPDKDDTVHLDLGIDGSTFGTGPLSQRVHDALMNVASNRFPPGTKIPEDLRDIYLLYAMDASAKEAVKVALDSNGFLMNLGDDISLEDQGKWGSVENVILYDSVNDRVSLGADGATSYGSFTDAIVKGGWKPGQGFSFVVRGVPSRQKGIDLATLLRSLDPDGSLREEAKEKGLLLPDEDIASLKDLATDCMQRVNSAPVQTLDEAEVFRGGSSKGYNVISNISLKKENRNPDGSENDRTLLHVMDALANHGCLIVDLTAEGSSDEDALKLLRMWEAASNFFDKIRNNNNTESVLPAMDRAYSAGSSHAMIGFASFKDGENQFLETRVRRSDGALMPEDVYSFIGEEGSKSLVDAFEIMAEVGKDIVRIATAASSVDAGSFLNVGSVVSQDTEGSPSITGLSIEEASVSGIWEQENVDYLEQPSKEDISRAKIFASEAAALLTEEILDDGKPLPTEIESNDESVSMSPHRICRYSNKNYDKNSKKNTPTSEIFGAHTDTTFVTIVPAASVSGLEVFDEDALQWYRPELYARKHAKNLELKGDTNPLLTWNCRYLIVIPGELLQLTSRNNIPAAVHRVVAAYQRPRLSAPVLLRARSGMKMDIERYMGNLERADKLLLETNGMKMEEIHDSLQMPRNR